jgi:DNA-binding XRE family transcriptional regulator
LTLYVSSVIIREKKGGDLMFTSNDVNLKEFRIEHGMSQVEFASRIGIHINTYISWERGVGNPNDEMQEKLDSTIDEIMKKGGK